MNSIFREAEEFRGEFTKTRAQAEVAGESSASNSIDFLAYAEQRQADLNRDRVFSLLQQRCAFGGVGEEAEGLECEQVEIMSDFGCIRFAFASRSHEICSPNHIGLQPFVGEKGHRARWKGVFNGGILFMDEDELEAVK